MRKAFACCLFIAALFAVPAFAQQPAPTGAVARCGNGWYVFVATGANTCAGYGGVAEWLAAARTPPAFPVTPPAPVTSATAAPSSAVALCGNGWYVYVATGGNTCAGYGGVSEWLAPARMAPATRRVPPNPVSFSSAPAGAVARCGNGWYAYVVTGANTCAGYGGVAEWLAVVRNAGIEPRAAPTYRAYPADPSPSYGSFVRRLPVAPPTYPVYSSAPSASHNFVNGVSGTATRIGSTTFYSDSDGVSGTANRIGSTRFYNFSDGVSGTSNRIGSTRFYNFNNSNNADTTTGTSTTIGQFQFHNLSNGVTGTSNQVGGFTFHNFSNGTHCTTNQIGTFIYTNCF